MKITTQHTVCAAVMLALCVFGPALATAQQQSTSADQARSTKVSLAGLDLSTPEGMTSARERLRGTAVRLCTQVADELDLSHHANFTKCVDSTVTSALRQIAGPVTVAAVKESSAPTPATPAVAGADRAKTVSLTDLDLSSPEGARVAHDRLYNVARTLCTQVVDDLDLSHHANYLACINDAMARTLPKIEQLARKNAPEHGLASNLGK
jgi:UrcA family protein